MVKAQIYYMCASISSVQSFSRVQLFETPWTAAGQASLSITKSRSLLKLMSIQLVMLSNHLILCHPLASCLKSFPASVFSMSQFFTSGGQSIGVSASASVLPMNVQDWFPLGWTGWISFQSKGLSRVFSNTTRASLYRHSAFFIVQLSHLYMTTGKTIALTRQTSVSKVMSLLFNMMSSLVITFLLRSKHLLISCLQSPSAVILEHKKIKPVTVSIASPSMYHQEMRPDAMILVFWMLSIKPMFSLSSFTFFKRLFSTSLLSAIRVVSSAYLRLLIYLWAILTPVYASSSPVFPMMCFAYKLNKQDDNIQPWHTSFLICNQFVVPCPVLTVASWPAHRFFRRQVRWSGIPISSRIFHSLLQFKIQRLWHSQ